MTRLTQTIKQWRAPHSVAKLIEWFIVGAGGRKIMGWFFLPKLGRSTGGAPTSPKNFFLIETFSKFFFEKLTFFSFLYAFISFTFQGWIRYQSFCSGRTLGALMKTMKYLKFRIILVITVCNLTLPLTLPHILPYISLHLTSHYCTSCLTLPYHTLCLTLLYYNLP